MEVFQNLIGNAVKYNEKTERWVEIGVLRKDGDGNKTAANGSNGLVIYVRDNGIGICEKNFESVFRIFKRLNGQKKFDGGSGIGMTITKRIIERHNGRIWLE